MHIFYTDKHLLHNPTGDWEVAARGTHILEALVKAGVGTVVDPVDWGMGPIKAVHSPELLNFLQTAHERMQREAPEAAVVPDCFAVRHLAGALPQTIWGQLGYFCTDSTTPILATTWPAAYWAVQTAVSAAHYMLYTGKSAYALCRPPGHHAYADLYGGYCYLNNAAIAAEWLVQQGKKVAILDLDYHHGNGTQALFYARDDLLFCSIHADPGQEYPYYSGYASEQGFGAGLGFTTNITLPIGTVGHVYLQAVRRAVMEIDSFQPDILLISLGVDTAQEDPNGGFLLREADFHAVGGLVAHIQTPKLVVQEGGYTLKRIGGDVQAFLAGILQSAA